MMPERSYRPISCAFYDELEALATLRKTVVVRYYRSPEYIDEITGQIVDFKIHNKIEYLIVASGQSIRLDDLIAVDGKALSGYC